MNPFSSTGRASSVASFARRLRCRRPFLVILLGAGFALIAAMAAVPFSTTRSQAQFLGPVIGIASSIESLGRSDSPSSGSTAASAPGARHPDPERPGGIITSTLEIRSDATWRLSSVPADGWQRPDFDDSAWAFAISPAPNACGWSSCGQNFPGSLSIWDASGQAYKIYVRKTFYIQESASIGSASVRTLADDDHDVYVNGTLVASDWDGVAGPELITDVKPYLRSGNNVIATVAQDTAGGCRWLCAYGKNVLVQETNTNTVLASSGNPSVYGQAVIFTATVTSTLGTPAGIVTFTVDSAPQETRPLASGVATFTTTALSVGTHQVQATYAGQGQFDPNVSPALTQTVEVVPGMICPKWDLAADFRTSSNQENPGRDACGTMNVWYYMTGLENRDISAYALLSLFNANVQNLGLQGWYRNSDAPPSLLFNPLDTPALLDGNTVVLPHSIDVHPGASDLVMVGWHSPIQGRIAITGTATDINPSPMFGDGVLWFIDKGPTNLASGVVPEGGTQIFRSGTGGSNLTNVEVHMGDFVYFIVHRNGSYYADSTRLVVSIRPVYQSDTSTVLTASPNPSVYGQSVTFMATVTSTLGTPTGVVTFTSDSAVPVTRTLSAGLAAYTSASLSVGTHAITATYSGDANFAPSTSPVLNQVVNKASTSTFLASSPNPSRLGRTITFTATVTSAGGKPTGDVTFAVDSAAPVTRTLSAGLASYTGAALSAGSHVVRAAYTGSPSFEPSTSLPLTQSVWWRTFLPLLRRNP
jgi:hypothetical protein